MTGAAGQTVDAELWSSVDRPGSVEPPRWRFVGLAIGVGFLGDLAVRSGVTGLAGAVLIVGTSAALLASGRVVATQARALVAAAPLFGVWVAVRTSPWLLPLDLAAAFALLVLGACLAGGGSVTDLPFGRLIARARHAVSHALRAPGFLAPLVRRHRDRSPTPGRAVAVGRGALIAAPVVAVLGGLLASADAVFASFFLVDIGVENIAMHGVLVASAAGVLVGLLRIASAAPPPDAPPVGWRLGRVETGVLLGSVAALFLAFAIAQVVAATGGAEHVLETAGLTYAEYARSGFFQLLWVAALTVGGLLVVRAVSDRSDPRSRNLFRALALTDCALTLVIVAAAFHRLDLYEDAYGLTMLRLYSSVFSLWAGLVVLLLVAWLAGVGAVRAWLPAAMAGSGLAVVLVLNVVNPEAIVARHNLTRQATEPVDQLYLSGLSADAVPTVVSLLPKLDLGTAAAVRAALCLQPHRDERFTGWAASNLAEDRAESARRRTCSSP